jgi:hypothetical protein
LAIVCIDERVVGVEVGNKLSPELFQRLRIAFLGQVELDPPNMVLILLEIVHNYYSNHQMEPHPAIASLIPNDHPYRHLLLKHADQY